MAVDNSTDEKVVTYLEHVGLTREQADVYIYLLTHGPATVLAISRGLASGRTKLYPLLQGLAALRLVTVHERHYGTSYEAAPPQVVEFLVAEQARSADALRHGLRGAVHALQQLQNLSPTTSRIVEHKGIEGVKQMYWNMAKAGQDSLIYESAALLKLLGKPFLENLRDMVGRSGSRQRILTNNGNRKPDTRLRSYRKLHAARCVDPEQLLISEDILVYGNCLAIVCRAETELSGTEFYNLTLADLQRRHFDFIWAEARALTA